MDNIKNYLVAGGVVVLVVLGVVIFQKVPIVNNVVQVPEPPLGAVVANEVQGSEFIVNGVKYTSYKQGFNTISNVLASTTLCQLRTGGATSTLQFASAQVSSSTIAGAFYEWGKSSAIQSTTTSFGTYTLASLQKATLVASTTRVGADIDPPVTFAPNTYLTLKTGNTLGRAGTCVAQFIVAN